MKQRLLLFDLSLEVISGGEAPPSLNDLICKKFRGGFVLSGVSYISI